MSNRIQKPNVKMFSKTISYLSFSQHINNPGHSGCFPLLQRGIEACPGATWWSYVVACPSSYARSASFATYQGQVWARGDFLIQPGIIENLQIIQCILLILSKKTAEPLQKNEDRNKTKPDSKHETHGNAELLNDWHVFRVIGAKSLK